ncbi:MAG: hypothetical protein H7A41_03900 [Chlamydiales bacterium]|nr:hypothetical protein [Chlamydiales bacterium]
MTECVREATGFSGYPEYQGGTVDFYQGYKHLVAIAMQFLRKQGLQGPARVFGALSWEPIASINAGFDIWNGKVAHFDKYGMNPTVLTDSEKLQAPTLLLHGRDGSQGMFTALGAYFKKNQMGPLFSVNLADGELTEEDFDVVDQKIKEISALYGEEVKINIIGYSRGAELALYMALPKDNWWIEEGGKCYLSPATRWRTEIGKVIRIGSMTLLSEWKMLSEEMKESIYEIRGKDDIHMPEPSYALNQYEVDGVGHVGLVSSSDVFDKLKVILDNSST